MSETLVVENGIVKGGESESQDVLIVLPVDHDRQLRQHAAERRTSRRQMINHIIAEWLERHEKYAQ